MARIETDSTTTDRAILGDGVELVFRTSGPQQHFFGYYDKSPLDAAGRNLLCHAVGFNNRMVASDDTADIGVWDIESGEYRKIASTRSFNWQQGAMLQWYPPKCSGTVIFNSFESGEFKAVILDIASGERRVLPTTIYAISPDGKYAVSPNYRRLFHCRPGYNYQNVDDQRWNARVPEGDGLHLMDIGAGTERLIISTRQVVENHHLDSMEHGHNYLEHAWFSPNGKRFMFMHRWQTEDGGIPTRLYTAGIDGDALHLFHDSLAYGHGCWKNEEEILIHGRRVTAFSRARNSRSLVRLLVKPLLRVNRMLPQTEALCRLNNRISSQGLLVFRDGVSEGVSVDRNSVLWDNGHCTVRPGNEEQVLVDTYADAHCRQKLLVFNLKRQTVVELADLYCPAQYHAKGWRCDLHPRWDRSGDRVVVDSLQDGTRQMYVYDVRNALK